jgi:predicted DNA-binding protein YlxM (UPF0122 family)
MIYHILNGDSLKEQFPESISGEKIVARECLVDGDVVGESLQDLFNTRAKFLSSAYGGTEKGYFDKTVPEFLKIEKIPNDTEINLWFEDDLFCQVNFWFVIFMLAESGSTDNVNLVRPSIDNQYAFSGMSSAALIQVYHDKKRIDQPIIQILSKFWRLYQSGDKIGMRELADQLPDDYGFVKVAIEADIDRQSINASIGRPKQTLLDIMQDLGTDDFGTIFREFNLREAIYGFGDLQVKRLLDEINNNHH